MKTMKKQLLLILFLTWIPSLQAGVSVVVNQANKSELDSNTIRKIFLGKMRNYPDGSKAEPFDLAAGNAARDEFRDRVLRKSEARLNSYWARMIFSSKAKPPRVLKSSAEVKSIINSHPSAIAYIDSNDVDNSMRTLLTID